MSKTVDHDTLERELLEHRDKLLGFIRTKVADPQAAEDILHDSLLKAARSLQQLDDPDKLVAWFYQIVRHAIIDRRRRQQTEAKYLEKYARDEQVAVTPDEQASLCTCLHDLIPTLKDEYQEMIEVMELGDGESEQVAQRLGISRNNLKVRRYRARNKLKERLEECCGDCAERGCLDCTCHE
ncbi:RNA polymerase sigma factor [Persicimonas caeni]|nr:sigma-70 family RNA polymerase sigma factor [Persicimonas caeni]